LINSSTKAVVATYNYTPWGEIESSSQTVSGLNSLRWKGLLYDSETGLYYMRARYYDPQTRRFISEDPIGLNGGINSYVFAGNDPVNGSDPTGLLECRHEFVRGYTIRTGDFDQGSEQGYWKVVCTESVPGILSHDAISLPLGLQMRLAQIQKRAKQLNIAGCAAAAGLFSSMLVLDGATVVSGGRVLVAGAGLAGATLTSALSTSFGVGAEAAGDVALGAAERLVSTAGRELVAQVHPVTGAATVMMLGKASSGSWSLSNLSPTWAGNKARFNAVAEQCAEVSASVW
jgi:RHS repeat-associated protein